MSLTIKIYYKQTKDLHKCVLLQLSEKKKLYSSYNIKLHRGIYAGVSDFRLVKLVTLPSKEKTKTFKYGRSPAFIMN